MIYIILYIDALHRSLGSLGSRNICLANAGGQWQQIVLLGRLQTGKFIQRSI